jgi:ribosomal protein S18 acetylase RimI-like enzyme
MYEEIEETTMGLPPTGRPAIEEWLRGLTTRGWNLLVTRGDEVVGHVAVAPSETPTPEFVIFVHPSFQDRGIGTELLEHVVAHAGDRDHDELTLNVSKDSRRAIAVYENIGFSVTNVAHLEMEMRLSLDDALVTAVQQPPAVRNG